MTKLLNTLAVVCFTSEAVLVGALTLGLAPWAFVPITVLACVALSCGLVRRESREDLT